MQSFKRNIIILTICCLWMSLGMTATHQYRKDVILRFPGALLEQGLIKGPQSIGIDFNDNLCILWDGTLSIYNDECEVIRKLNFLYRIPMSKPYDLQSVCFDEDGNIYILMNNSGAVTIYKSDPNGQMLGKMEINIQLVHEQIPSPYTGILLSYFPQSGLSISTAWYTVPLDFQDGHVPDITVYENDILGFPLANGGDVVLIPDENISEVLLNVSMDNGTQESLLLTGSYNLSCDPVYSLDTQYEYYLLYKQGSPGEKYTREIRKYQGDDLVFTTGEIPKNTVYQSAIDVVVDSHGTIYYYAGDEEEIQILRWVLK